jgi:hypothetical protein
LRILFARFMRIQNDRNMRILFGRFMRIQNDRNNMRFWFFSLVYYYKLGDFSFEVICSFGSFLRDLSIISMEGPIER